MSHQHASNKISTMKELIATHKSNEYDSVPTMFENVKLTAMRAIAHEDTRIHTSNLGTKVLFRSIVSPDGKHMGLQAHKTHTAKD